MRRKGYIWHEFWICCGRCGGQDPLAEVNYPDALIEAKRLGYRRQKNFGWICGKCAHELASERRSGKERADAPHASLPSGVCRA